MSPEELVKRYHECRKNLTPEQTKEALALSLEQKHKRWYEVYENGASDPFYPDGVSLELIKNHMIYYKTQLKQLFPDDLPDIYYQPLPPDFPTGYMVVGTKYFDKRMKNMNGWSLVFSKPDEGLALF